MRLCTAMRLSLFIIRNQGGGDGYGRIYSPYARPSSSSDFFCSGLIQTVSSLVSVDGFPVPTNKGSRKLTLCNHIPTSPTSNHPLSSRQYAVRNASDR